MDPRERWEDLSETLRVMVQRYLGRVWTALPIKITTDSDGHTVKAQPLIKGRQLQDDGKTYKDVQLPSLGEVPVHFASGGGFTMTHPVKDNDEGLSVFSTLCIDEWWDKGGIQPQTDIRRHHLADGFYIPGFRSNKRKLNPAPSSSSMQMRTDDGKTYVEVQVDKVRLVTNGGTAYVEITKDGIVNIKASGGVNILEGDLKVTGEIVAKSGSLNIHVSTHRHSGVQAGGAQTQMPVPGS